MASAPDRLSPARVTHRAMVESDVGAIGDLENLSYMFPWSAGIFRDCLRVGYTCRIIESMDGLGGYAIMSMGAGEAHILNICVRADLRGQNVGRRLMTWLLDEAGRAGQSWVFLEVRPSNRPALLMYESLGFAQVGLRRGYYQAVGGREDAIVYRLDLDVWAAARERAANGVRPAR